VQYRYTKHDEKLRNSKPDVGIENGENEMHTLESEDSGIGVHEGRVSGDRPAEGLIGHGHIDDDDAVLRRRFSHADVLVRLHRHVRERDELWVDPQAR
jgi:hypothetical protein